MSILPLKITSIKDRAYATAVGASYGAAVSTTIWGLKPNRHQLPPMPAEGMVKNPYSRFRTGNFVEDLKKGIEDKAWAAKRNLAILNDHEHIQKVARIRVGGEPGFQEFYFPGKGREVFVVTEFDLQGGNIKLGGTPTLFPGGWKPPTSYDDGLLTSKTGHRWGLPHINNRGYAGDLPIHEPSKFLVAGESVPLEDIPISKFPNPDLAEWYTPATTKDVERHVGNLLEEVEIRKNVMRFMQETKLPQQRQILSQWEAYAKNPLWSRAKVELPGVCKAVGAGAALLMTAWAAYDGYRAYKADNYTYSREMAKFTGRTLGGVIGGSLGSLLWLPGAIGGGLAGANGGEMAASYIYDGKPQEFLKRKLRAVI